MATWPHWLHGSCGFPGAKGAEGKLEAVEDVETSFMSLGHAFPEAAFRFTDQTRGCYQNNPSIYLTDTYASFWGTFPFVYSISATSLVSPVNQCDMSIFLPISPLVKSKLHEGRPLSYLVFSPWKDACCHVGIDSCCSLYHSNTQRSQYGAQRRNFP